MATGSDEGDVHLTGKDPEFCCTPKGVDPIITPLDADFQAVLDATRRGVSADWGTPESAWDLTVSLSQLTRRRSVRVDVRDAHGDFTNSYTATYPSDSTAAPDGPWALPLTDTAGGFRYLCFDLDAKGGNPAKDAHRLTRWLDELAIAYLVCESGPSGGRHIWIALTAPADAGTVNQLARRARTVLPSLDLSPLTNPATGAVRPPLSPHRAGGHSRPLGPVEVLLRPTTTPQRLRDLDVWLDEEGVELPPAAQATRPRDVDADADGHPYLAGERRDLSPRIREILAAPPAADTSATMAQIFLAAANARWRRADVAALARTAPALEHARTRRHASTRVPRTEAGQRHVIDGAWRMAVYYAAANPSNGQGDDPTFPQRENHVVAALTRVQERADALPGMWGADRGSTTHRAARGSAAHRAILDALCLYMAQAVSLEIEADIRRLALETGWGRQTAHNALRALQDAGWIRRTAQAEGEHGARYTLSEKFSTDPHEPDWSQGRMPPARTALIRELTLRTTALNQDIYAAPGSLGRAAGYLHLQLLPGGSWTVADLTLRTGFTAASVRRLLHRLHSHGLVRLIDGHWTAADDVDPQPIAARLFVDGHLADRARRYDVERIVWAKWRLIMHEEHQAHRKRHRGRRAHPSALQLPGQSVHERVGYPRGPNQRYDHKTARRLEAARLNARELATFLEAQLTG